MSDNLLLQTEHEAASAPKQTETTQAKKIWEMPEIIEIQVKGTAGVLFDADFSPQS